MNNYDNIAKLHLPCFVNMKNMLFIFVCFLMACKSFPFQKSKVQAPKYFKARFETTKGNFEIEAYRAWSPLGVDRLYQLIKNKYYTNIPLYRIIPNFVAQFGGVDTFQNAYWEKHKLADEKVIEGNTKGSIAFARDGKDTRGTQLFINLKDNNPRLDTINYLNVKGFPVIAKVTKGMEVVNTFFSYKEEPGKILDSLKHVPVFFKENYPNMDYIKKAYIIK